MVNHNNIAEIACQKLSKIAGVAKIVLFGSVARNEQRPNSDIDIAIVFHDEMRGLPLDLEGFPAIQMPEANRIAEEISSRNKIPISLLPVWESEYSTRVLIGSKYNRGDLLNDVGKVMYDWRV